MAKLTCMLKSKSASDVKGPADVALQLYLRYYLAKTFAGAQRAKAGPRVQPEVPTAFPAVVTRTAGLLASAKRPVIVVGSQATLGGPRESERLAEALGRLGVPVYLSGMARGLMGKEHDVWFRHKRTKALGEADFVLLAGVPNDFRLNYGLQINRKANFVSVNRSDVDVRKNRKPKIGAVADPCDFICRLAREASLDAESLRPWLDRLRTRDRERCEQIDAQEETDVELVNPISLCKSMEELELSVRSYNCLKNANIQTIAELVQKTDSEMLRTRNFGRKSLNEIKEILDDMGLHLGIKLEEDALKQITQARKQKDEEVDIGSLG